MSSYRAGFQKVQENRDFHVIQEVEAAFRRYSLLKHSTARVHVLIASTRYLEDVNCLTRVKSQHHQIQKDRTTKP